MFFSTKARSWALLVVLLGSAIYDVTAQDDCASQGVTDPASCTVFCGGTPGGGMPNSVWLDSGVCTCLGCLFCNTCTGKIGGDGGDADSGPPASVSGRAPTTAPEDSSDTVVAQSVPRDFSNVNTSNASIIFAEHTALVMLPMMGMLVSAVLYRKYRNGRREMASLPLVAENIAAKSNYGAVASEMEVQPLMAA